jgi:ribosomal protein S18 acetylase RimI-like enzyme
MESACSGGKPKGGQYEGFWRRFTAACIVAAASCTGVFALKHCIRPARLTDLDALEQLEQACFSSDLLSRARLRHWIRAANGILLVAVAPGRDAALLGSCLVLTRRNSRKARLYSIATAPAARGQGLGARLLAAAERAARRQGCDCMQLEVAEDNARAIQLYQDSGYAQFGFIPGFYEDGHNALRMQKGF